MKIAIQQLRSSLLRGLGLCGSLHAGKSAVEVLTTLGTLQLDSIRVTGLRNHELAILARVGDPGLSYEHMVYKERRFFETHYPIHAVRYDWLNGFRMAFGDSSNKNTESREALEVVRRDLLEYISSHGPVSAQDLDSDRVRGGFSTIKATTKALEQLFFDGRIMIADRTSNFHRIFELTEHVAPEFSALPTMSDSDYWDFLISSAMEVLKVGTIDQISRRVRIHYGQWRRGLSIKVIRDKVKGYLEKSGAVKFQLKESKDNYWGTSHFAEVFEEPIEPDSHVRIIPPLDNLLFSRERFKQLFELEYLFEAYKPKDQRKYYYGMPVLYRGKIVAILDIKLADSIWRIVGGEIFEPATPLEAFRHGISRVALRAGAQSIETTANLGPKWRRYVDQGIN